MARDVVTAVALALNDGVDVKNATVGVAIVPANGAEVAVADGSKMIVHVKNTAGAEYDVTISAGAFSDADIGDVVVPVALTSGEQMIGPFETSRFKQADEKIYIDFETNMTGTVAVYLLP